MSDNPTAFPFDEKSGDGTHWHSHSGMTLRDYFAGQVIPAIWASCAPNGQDYIDAGQCTAFSMVKVVAAASYEIADAMLAERAKATRDREGV